MTNEMILGFDTRDGFPAPLVVVHTIPTATDEEGNPLLTDAEEVARATLWDPADLVLQRGDPEDFDGVPKDAVTIAAENAAPVVNPRKAQLARNRGQLRALEAEASPLILDALVAIVTAPGVIDESLLSPNELSLLERLRDGVAPQGVVQVGLDLDEAVAAQAERKALHDRLPSRAR